MKLLIFTQVVDKGHPVLGFFHRWLEEFAKNCDEVIVVCLQAGKRSLPANVKVYSLGKDEGKGRLTYIYRFYKYIWKYRHSYDSVFIHMNQIYVILGGLFWRWQNKKIGLWYMHGQVSVSLKIAERLTNIIFTGSPESFRLPSRKIMVTGHGIDTNKFFPQKNIKRDIDLITVGRITPSKNLEFLISVLKEVCKRKKVTLTIVGKALTVKEKIYEEKIKSIIKQEKLEDNVYFYGQIDNDDLPAILNRSKVFVHAATNGSLDKALLEPLAVKTPVVTMALGASSLPLGNWKVNSLEDFSQKVIEILSEVDDNYLNKIRKYVVENHSIISLIPKICHSYERK